MEPEGIFFGLHNPTSFDALSGLGVLKFAGIIRF
jgi:hypothetical protein